MRKKCVLLFLVLTIVAPAMMFAGGRSESDAAESRELTVWFGREDFIPDDRFETFHRENPDIRVDFSVVPLEALPTQYITARQAGNQPDIFNMHHDKMIPLAQQGLMKDISPILERWEQEDPDDFNDMSNFAFSVATYDGVTYGVAPFGGPRFHAYRVDVFDEHGLDAPETWNDVLEAARTVRSSDMLGITLHGGRSQVVWGWIGSKFLSMGGEFVDGVMQIDSDAGVAIIEFYQTVMREGLIDPDALSLEPGDFRAAFIDGRAAQFFEAANLYPTIEEQMDYGTEWRSVIQPYREGARDQRTIGGFGWPWYASDRMDDDDAALKFYQYHTRFSHEVSARYQPPTRLSAFDRITEIQPWWEDIAYVFEEMEMFPIHPRGAEMAEVLADVQQWALSNPNGDARAAAQRYQADFDALAQ